MKHIVRTAITYRPTRAAYAATMSLAVKRIVVGASQRNQTKRNATERYDEGVFLINAL